MGQKTDYEIKIPRGTVIQVAGHPVQLKTSLYLERDRDEFRVEDHKILQDFGDDTK